jgi:hypothetical protein
MSQSNIRAQVTLGKEWLLKAYLHTMTTMHLNIYVETASTMVTSNMHKTCSMTL